MYYKIVLKKVVILSIDNASPNPPGPDGNKTFETAQLL